MISVIIPTLDASLTLEACLKSAQAADEIIVVDGGSLDGTSSIISKVPTVQWVNSQPGRAKQMNAGASQANGDILLFLHADTVLPADWKPEIEQLMADAGNRLGAFRFKLATTAWQARWIEWGVHFRNRFHKRPYGDQALFIRRRDFEQWGGFPDQPLFEDVELVRKAKASGSVAISRKSICTSAEKWVNQGWFRQTFKNARLIRAYQRSAQQVHTLAKEYYPAPPGLATFCKYPEPGRVKTRLAQTVGDPKAIEVYRMLVQHTLDVMKRLPVRGYVFFDPPEGDAKVREWLGLQWFLVPQQPGDLGERLNHAFTFLLDRSTKGIIIGTDCPGIEVKHVQQALEALDSHDVVLGPTYDGGYYLIGTKQHYPALFEDIPWSTEQVLATTQQKAQENGLSVFELEYLHDLDTETDLVTAQSTCPERFKGLL